MKTIGSTIIMLALASSLFADNGKELKLASPDGTHEINSILPKAGFTCGKRTLLSGRLQITTRSQ